MILERSECVKIAKIVDAEVKKVLPALFKKVRERIRKETAVKVVKQRKANKNRPCLGDHVEADQVSIQRSGPKGRTLTENYNIKFLSFSYKERECAGHTIAGRRPPMVRGKK